MNIDTLLNENSSEQSSEASEKQRSEFLGTRDAVTGQVTIQPGEEMQAFDAFVREMVLSLAPETFIERQLAQSYAGYQWRINRSAAIEESMFTLGNIEEIAENLNIQHPEAHNAATNAKTFRRDSDIFARVTLYSQRLVHQSETILKRLLALQADRKERQQTEMTEAARLYQFHEMHQVAFDPETHGIHATLDQIKAFARRRTLQTLALKAEKHNYNRRAYTQSVGQFAA